MSYTITATIVHDAYSGTVAGKSFAKAGADVRAAQESRSWLHTLLHLFVDYFSDGASIYSAQQQSKEIHTLLSAQIERFATAMLKLKPNSIERIQIRVDPADDRVVFPGVDDDSLELNCDAQGGVSIGFAEEPAHALLHSLPNLKKTMLIEYLAVRRKEHPGKRIAMAEFDLSNVDLSDLDLRDCNFSGATLRGTIFTSCDLHGTQFTDANLTDANFQNANLTKANFNGALLTRANFSWAILTGASFVRANLIKTNMTQARAPKADFTSAYLAGTLGRRFKAQSAIFDRAQFINMTIKDWDIRNAKFANTVFWNVKAENMKLNGHELPRETSGIIFTSSTTDQAPTRD